MAAVLALLFALAGAASATEPASLSVSGEAMAEVAPDLALVSFEVEATRPTADEASAEAARQAKAVIDGLKSEGVAAADIQTDYLFLAPWDSNGSGPKTYRASETLVVTIRALPQAGKLLTEAAARGGLYRGMSYDIADREKREDALRVAAVENARRRAELYAKGAGMKLGPIRSLAGNGSGFAPRGRVFSRFESAKAPDVPVEAGMVTLTQSVQATFDLLPP